MKKLLIIITLVCLTGFAEEKKLSASLTLQQWNVVLGVIEQSNASYQDVKAVKELLVPQLQKQIIDTTKNKR